MQVTVKYFASLREQFGKSEEVLTIDSDTTVTDLWERLTAEQKVTQDVKTAVNQEYVKPETVLADKDEVAFFPPVTGG